jgi:hypothetical protein
MDRRVELSYTDKKNTYAWHLPQNAECCAIHHKKVVIEDLKWVDADVKKFNSFLRPVNLKSQIMVVIGKKFASNSLIEKIDSELSYYFTY